MINHTVLYDQEIYKKSNLIKIVYAKDVLPIVSVKNNNKHIFVHRVLYRTHNNTNKI